MVSVELPAYLDIAGYLQALSMQTFDRAFFCGARVRTHIWVASLVSFGRFDQLEVGLG